MKIKPGANIQGLNLKMRPVLMAADAIWRNHGQELVVTAGLDGEHSAGSLHYYGMAVDLRTRYFRPPNREEGYIPDEVEDIANEMRHVLGAAYDVIVHASHIHVEYDPA